MQGFRPETKVTLLTEEDMNRLLEAFQGELNSAIEKINSRIEELSSSLKTSQGEFSKELGLLTYSEVMEIFKLKDRSSLYRRIKKGEISPINIGKRVYFKASEINSLIKEKQTRVRIS